MIPTANQVLLLRACLFSGGDAADAWKSWREHVNFDDIDAASYRLIPLLYKNLRRENIEDELLGRLKGIYRHTWSRNQLLFHDAIQVMTALQSAGISVLVLKGATLASSFYSDTGLRPMNDFDFMVPLNDVFRAFDVMKNCGWNCEESLPFKQLVWCSHAAKWTNRAARQIDLHWHLLPEGRQPGTDDDLWARAIKRPLGAQTFLSMDDTDLFWHICAHGAIGDEIPAIRWIADAWTILQKNSALDWERLVATVRKRKLTLPVGRALAYLRKEFGAPVPIQVVETLTATTVSWVERWEHRIKSSPRGIFGALPLHCVNYIRLTTHDSVWRKIAGVPVFFQHVWGVSSAPGLLVYVAKKALNRPASRRQINNS
jgi:hypothetical protein